MRPRESASSPFTGNAVKAVLGPAPRRYVPPIRPQAPTIPPADPHAPVSVVWFRGHDLRVHDHAALDAAVQSGATIVALYVLECGPEIDDPCHYVCRRRNSGYRHCDVSSAYSDVMSTVTSDSGSAAPPPAHKPETSRLLWENEIYSWSPLSPNGGFALGRVQRWYLHHSLCVLQKELENLGITLILRRVDSADGTVPVVVSVAKALGAGTVFWNKRYKPCAHPVDEAVSSSLRAFGVYSAQFDSETLILPSMGLCGMYNDFQSYTRFWIDAMRTYPPQRPNRPIDKANVMALERSRVYELLARADTHKACTMHCFSSAEAELPSIADLELLKGLSLEGADSPGNVDTIGCVAARHTVSRFLENDRFSRFACGKARRDGMVIEEDLATSRLSPHLRFGEISPRVLFYEIVDAGAAAQRAGDGLGVEAAQTFLKNMSLRDFGYYMLSRYPSAAYKPIMPEFEAFPWEEDEDGALSRAWETGTTGFPIVDAAMRQLLREGWIHNRMRFLVASFYCKYLLLPWPVGAAYLVRTLVDGDEACNSLGWQWTAGCNSDSFPFSTLVNPLSLYTHTRSRERAAEYVRKYVPELAHLPDRLVFTPWKATDEERAAYRLNLLPLRKYNEVCQDSPYCHGSIGQSVLYPERVVLGKDARFRARRAMEVMRRIFSAQRQCHTIIAEQELSGNGTTDRKHPRVFDVEMITKRQRTVEGVQILDADGKPVVELDISEFDSSVSCVSDAKDSRKASERRKREDDETETRSFARKRRRTSPLNVPEQSQLRTPSQTPTIQGTPMMSIAVLSSPPADAGPQVSSYIAGEAKGREVVQTTSPKSASGATSKKSSSPRNLKRPRPVTPKMGQTSSDRLSLRNLLSPSLTNDVGTTVPSPPFSQVQASRGSPMVAPSNMNALPKLAQVASYQNPAPGNENTPNDPTTSDLLANKPSRMIRGSPPLPSDRRPPTTPSPRTPQVKSTPRMQRKSILNQNGNDGLNTPQTSARMAPSPASPFPYHSSPTYDNAAVDLNTGRVTEGDGTMVGSTANARVAGPQAQMKRETVGPVPSFAVQRAQAPAVFHPSVSPVPLISNQYHHSQHHNPQMMVSFRPSPNNPMPMPHFNHTGSAIPSQNVSQGYFATNTVSPNPHQPAGQQVLWYPTLPPYVELRGHGLPGPVMPQLMHPISRQHHHGMPIGYHVPGASTMVSQRDPSRMVAQAGVPVPFTDVDGSARRGPSSPIEREAIARRMAAMDYQDDKYGGKHWEQWQAIALHLLNQYEFSEDTDRDTSRAYVRLCVLKDELRNANPNGPRVTVNHCKEVFTILNLPVTGEWDRRGHGGVRGPYVYGCVKKSGVHVSRR